MPTQSIAAVFIRMFSVKIPPGKVYFTTIFTMRLGTEISFITVLPSMKGRTRSSAFAFAIASGAGQFIGSSTVARSFPFTWTATSTVLSTVFLSSY